MWSIAMMRCDRPFFQNTGGPREQARQDLVPIDFVEHFVAPTGIEIARDVFEAGGHERFNRSNISSDVLAHAVGDLDHAADRTTALPSDARDAQSVGAHELKRLAAYRRHRPWNCGARFSRNADVPSFLSSVAAQRPKYDA